MAALISVIDAFSGAALTVTVFSLAVAAVPVVGVAIFDTVARAALAIAIRSY